MALFKILSNMVDNNPPDPYGYIDNQEDAGLAQVRSEATGLPNTFNQGYCYFDRSTGKFWIDTTPTNSGTVTLSNKNDTSKSHVQGRIPINAYYADLAKLATSATYDDAGNTIASTYLKLSGGNITGHIYLTGSQANSSTANTSQLIFGTPTTEHIAISSNTKALILNPTHNSTTNQIVLYLDKASKFPSGIEANITGNLTGKATTAGTADVANLVAWNNVSSKPNLVNKITTTAGAHTVIANQTGNVSFSIPTTAAHVGAAAKEITVYNPPATFYIKTDFLASGTQNMIYGYLQGNGYSGTPPIHVDFQVYNYTATSLINGKQYDATGAIGQMSCFRGTDGYLYIKVERGAGNQTFKIFIYKMSHGNDENHAIEVLSTAPEMEAGSEHIFTKYIGIHDGIFTTAYDMIYANASNKATRLGPNKSTTKKFLRMTGTGSDGAAPAWDTVNKSDVGLGNVENTKLSTWTGSSYITTIGTLSSGTVPWDRLSGIPAGANKLIQDEITIQTGDTTQQHITLQTLMTWLITTKQYIPSNMECYKYLPVSWAYASNDILQLSCNGTNYELQLAGCIIEFWGKATNYNTGVFRLGIHSNSSANFTASSGYTKFPNSSYIEYTCNGSSYNPTWRMVTAASNSAPSLSWGSSSTIGSVNGVNLTVTMPANPNTDTKVTSVDNHYAPTANTNSELTATLSGTAGNYAINTEYTVLTGIKAQRDSKGHVTGLTYTAQKVKDTNTDTKVTQAYSTTNNSYPLLMSATAGVSSTDSRGDTTSILNNNIYANPNTGTLSTKNLIITDTSSTARIEFSRTGGANAPNYIQFPANSRLNFVGGATRGTAVSMMILDSTEENLSIFPGTTNQVSLGTTSNKWNNIYAKTVTLSQDPVNALEAATKQYVDSSFATNDAMIFKGVLNGATSTTYTPAADRGHTYKVATAGKINGINVEVGDVLICTNDSTAAATSSNVNTIKNNWVIVQTNLDGAVVGPAGGVDDGNIAVFSGTSGHIIKKGTTNTENVIKTITFNGGTTPTLGDNISADDITNWSQGTLPSLSINTVNCDDITSWTAGSVTTATVANGVLTITTGTASSLSYTPRSIGSASNWGAGTLPSLSYTSRSIPNVTNIGTIATLTTESQSVITSIL